MWFFIGTLVLWATTAQMAHWDNWAFPTITKWTWWTLNLHVCGLAALEARFASLREKVAGLLGLCLVVIYYRTMAGTYKGFVPTNESFPDLWPAIFVAVNLVAPWILISVGVLSSSIQRRG